MVWWAIRWMKLGESQWAYYVSTGVTTYDPLAAYRFTNDTWAKKLAAEMVSRDARVVLMRLTIETAT